MPKTTYVLEVCEFITEKEGDNGWLAQGEMIKHIGYMKGCFKTKKDAKAEGEDVTRKNEGAAKCKF